MDPPGGPVYFPILTELVGGSYHSPLTISDAFSLPENKPTALFATI